MSEDRPRAEPKRKAPVDALVKQADPTKVVAYFCTNCGTVYSDKGGTGKEDAERCGVKSRRRWGRSGPDPEEQTPCSEWACEDCGEECSPYQWYCSKCLSSRNVDREDVKLAKAEVIENYPCDQGVVSNGNYYHCIDDFIDHCESNEYDIPDRVWATEPRPFQLNADDILEHAFEEWSDGCEDAEPYYSGEEEFRAAVAAFNEANKDKLLYFETNKAVDLTEYKGDEIEDEDEEEEEV